MNKNKIFYLYFNIKFYQIFFMDYNHLINEFYLSTSNMSLVAPRFSKYPNLLN